MFNHTSIEYFFKNHETGLGKNDGALNILLHILLRQSLQSNDSCNWQWYFCTLAGIFGQMQTAPVVSGLKGAFSSSFQRPQSDLGQGS